jgi:hypothetical protein
MKPNKKLFTCFYCHLRHAKVEARGMWHCPNPTCPGPGAHWFRQKLMTYKATGEPNGGHTVSDTELRLKARWYLKHYPILWMRIRITETRQRG